MERSASSPSIIVVGGNNSGGGSCSRRTSRIEDVSQIEDIPEVEAIQEENEEGVAAEEGEMTEVVDDDEVEYQDPKSRYFSPPNVVCIIFSLVISAYFIFEPQLVSTFWNLFSPEETNEYLLNLKTCKIPYLYDGRSELPFMWTVDISKTNDLQNLDLKCRQVEKFSSVLDDNKLVLLSKLKKRKCCVRDITRADPDVMVDDSYDVSNCTEIRNMSDISGKEFVMVECNYSKNKSVDFNTHALIPIKPSVQDKLDYWISEFNNNGNSFENGDERPFSVAVIVVGSTSRAHAYRSIPDTMSFLEEKSGFIVMNGYNIMEDTRTTLSPANMIPLITGGPGPKEGDVIKYWDNETRLLSEFENEKFVTMYNDASRKLLRSSHDPSKVDYRFRSFLQQPADYYMRPFLEAHKEATEALHRPLSKHHCFGKRTSTSYLLRHLIKFHKKFSSVPSFSFSYFDWPQSQHGLEALTKMDRTFLEFFKEFLKTPQTLERTAIVFMSDIGSLNHPYYKTEHGRLEKLNPLLMIRLPDNLVSKNPTLKQNLRINSHRLISPIDVHQSIYIFSKIMVPKRLPDNTTSQNDNDDERKITGRNVFVSEIPYDRTCSQANIPEHLCACGRSLPDNFDGMSIVSSKDGQPEKYWHYHMLSQ